jgi:lipopolysaccharide/colanic/teichoic acid biosynthesis glycosyltransferase
MSIPSDTATRHHAAWPAGASTARASRGVRVPYSVALPVLAISLFVATALVWNLFASVLITAAAAVAFAGVAVKRREVTAIRLVVVGDRGFADALARPFRGGRPIEIVAVVGDADPAEIPVHDAVIVQASAFARLEAALPHAKSDGTVLLVAPDDLPGDVHPLAPAISRGGQIYKRSLDLAVGTIGLLVASPVLLALVIAVKLDSRGPAFFSQPRVGRDGRQFRIYKLRSMRVGNDEKAHADYVASLIRGEAERQNGMFKLVDDPRITRVGRILRKYSLDELPQLWNVVRGDMSAVGPRPALPRETQLFDARMWQRNRVKPGLTGLAQVSGRCELAWSEQIAYDVAYWQQWSPASDLLILIKTPAAILKQRGAA